jgi:SanA protein
MVIVRAAKDKIYSDFEMVPHRRVGLVLGCRMSLSHGRPNLFFLTRIRAAAALYRHGKVDYLLVSGGNPTGLKNALIHQGVRAERIYLDYSSFRTLDSVVRAKEVFGQTEVTIVSQEFQNQRAIFIAKHYGLDAIGFNAQDVISPETHFREHFARARALLDIYLFHTQPSFRGDRVARASVSLTRNVVPDCMLRDTKLESYLLIPQSFGYQPRDPLFALR